MAFTYFFRDLATLNAIKEHVIPELRKNRYIRVWDAGWPGTLFPGYYL